MVHHHVPPLPGGPEEVSCPSRLSLVSSLASTSSVPRTVTARAAPLEATPCATATAPSPWSPSTSAPSAAFTVPSDLLLLLDMTLPVGDHVVAVTKTLFAQITNEGTVTVLK